MAIKMQILELLGGFNIVSQSSLHFNQFFNPTFRCGDRRASTEHICLRMKGKLGEKQGQARRSRYRSIKNKLSYGEEVSPVVLLVADKVAEVRLKGLICPFGLPGARWSLGATRWKERPLSATTSALPSKIWR
jgi:hypothetical protein